jgi:23S rRNA (uracil1939-C5)-methyltransferase
VKRGDELTIKLESFAFGGKSIAHVDGLVVFIVGGIPGDTVRVRLTKVKKQYAEAETLELLMPSPLRARPRCGYFGTCGGCTWQQVDYKAQLEFKRQHVIEALEHIGGFSDVEVKPTLGADEIYFYRNKMEFSFGERWLTKEEFQTVPRSREPRGGVARFALGLHIPNRFDRVLDIEECHLQSETSYHIVNAVRSFCVQRQLSIYSTIAHTGYLRNLVISGSSRTQELMVNLVTSEDSPETMQAITGHLLEIFPLITTVVNNISQRKAQVATGEQEKIYHGPGFITERIGKRIYRVSANSFFQTNTTQAERLYDTALRLAQLKPEDTVFDLYSGTGTIALHIADAADGVVGIESAGPAVEDARRNASMNGVSNCRFLLGDLKDRLTKDTSWMEQYPKPNVVIVDPPRTGLHEKVAQSIVLLRPERIVYVSCNPATQARDLKLMCRESMYRIVDVQPVDMFPQTYHIETVVGLSLVV